jgi:hypothetical protein
MSTLILDVVLDWVGGNECQAPGAEVMNARPQLLNALPPPGQRDPAPIVQKAG